MPEITSVGVLGCGLMGSGIAQTAAAAGFRTTVRDVSEALLHQGRDNIAKSLAKLVEKANDLLVARRQKRKGMHWSRETSEALARLKALRLNHEWDAYWDQRQLPRLVAA